MSGKVNEDKTMSIKQLKTEHGKLNEDKTMTIKQVKTEHGKLNEDKTKAIKLLKTARGQLDGIINMIEQGRYCIDVSNQIMASQALLKKSNSLILKQHLQNCVMNATDDGDMSQKINEIVGILSKIYQ